MNTRTRLIIAILIGISQQSFAQEKLNVSAGFGLPELLNVGAHYQLDQAQIGARIGSVPVNDEKLMSIIGEAYYHFAGHSELSERRPWYGKAGLNYLREETDASIFKYIYLNLRVGRDFNISKKFGIAIDAGTTIELHYKEIEKEPSNNWFDLDFPVFPSLQASVFYRI